MWWMEEDFFLLFSPDDILQIREIGVRLHPRLPHPTSTKEIRRKGEEVVFPSASAKKVRSLGGRGGEAALLTIRKKRHFRLAKRGLRIGDVQLLY